LRSCAHEAIHIAHHATQHFVRSAGCARIQHLQQAQFAIFLFALIQGFDQAVGEDYQPIASCKTRLPDS
jgi:hypothetical protein